MFTLAVENLATAVKELRADNDKLPIVICLVTPRDVADAPILKGALQKLNNGLKRLADGKENIAVVDVFTPLAMPDGKPNPELFGADRIHPTAAGYAKWTALLAPALEKLGVK